ncbi:putative ribonuclease H protein, partial [Trifolium pratense]
MKAKNGANTSPISSSNGKRIGFWKEKWIGNAPLQDMFPNLFAKETDQLAEVAKRLVGNSLNRVWNWNWCSNLTAEEEEELRDLLELLFDVEVVADQHDNWRWIPENSGLFAVKSVYVLLLNDRITYDINENTVAALESLWNNDIPSKVGVFGEINFGETPNKNSVSLERHIEEGWKHFNLFGDIVKDKKGVK